ncbi:hypothetical protein GQ53DRAFT_223213 [Thozetella sp. PMI_491]|nr:hypothetical protein GQ53DRAFT_223213 [Thozetella sp. PMI_491]
MSAPPQGFIQLNKGAGPPGGRPPPPPPGPAYPGQGGGARPAQVITVNPGPNGNAQGMGPVVPPPPNRDMVPFHLQQPPLVQISDIRRERMTEAEAREELADYFIIRIEKVEEGSGYTDEGELRKSTWDQVIRREVRDISKPEAVRQIRYLGRDKSLLDKKRKLNPPQQSQLERAQEDLVRRELDQRYQIKLVQLDHQTRLKRGSWTHDYHKSGFYGRGSRSGSRDRHRDESPGRKGHRKSSSSSRRSQGSLADFILAARRPSRSRDGKPLKETVSITAYYKRCLKPEFNAVATLMQRDAELQRRLLPPNPQHVFPPQQMHGPPHPHPPQHPPGPKPGAGQAAGPFKGPAGPRLGPGPGPGLAPMAQENKGGKAQNKSFPSHRRKSAGSSRSSDLSDSCSDTDGVSTIPTSSESSRDPRRSTSKGRAGTKKEDKIRAEGPIHYGISSRHPPYKSRRHLQHRLSDEFLVGGALPSQGPRALPQLTPVAIEQIRADAYALGRADERLDTREHVERVTELALTRNPPPVVPAVPAVPPPPAPAFLQRRPTVRLVHASDVAHRLEDEELDRLERFRFDDGRYDRRFSEPRYEPRYVDAVAEAVANRQAYEERLRREDELIDWEEEQMERERGRRPPELRRYDSLPNSQLFEPNVNPFGRPGPRRRATMSSTYYDD